MRDQLGRPLRDLRISVTDRCNYRCGYCMPGDRTYRFLPKRDLLSFEEIVAIARIAASLGVEKLRITGGEPLLRRDLPQLIHMLVAIEGIRDVALTTNGFFLGQFAEALRTAGLQRITVSLDSLDTQTYARLAGRQSNLRSILDNVDKAANQGFPVKINTVVQRGINDREIPEIVRFCRDRGFIPRFIEFMDVGNVNEWHPKQVFSAREILDSVHKHFPCEPVDPNYQGEVAKRYRFLDGGGEFGIIASVTQPFCGSCHRARLTADGQLFTCLFANQGQDLRALLRGDQGISQVTSFLKSIWSKRSDQYSAMRHTLEKSAKKVEMYHIGG